MKLHTLKPNEGSVRKKKRVGRGQGSGKGGTSTRGNNGDQSRSGYHLKFAFEGGQMPIQRRLPKFGFVNPFRVEYEVVNLDTLTDIIEDNPGLNSLDHAKMHELGLIRKPSSLVKILGRGELKSRIEITANKFSETAKAAIEKNGGKAITIGTIG